MRNESFVKGFAPGAAVNAYRIVKHGANDNTVIQAIAPTDGLLGVANQHGAAATDDTVDVVMAGIAEVEYGGTVARGDRITADAVGRGVAVTASGNLHALISGGAAGDHTVTGILTTDELLAVFEQDGTSGLLTDLTSEFSISAADTINNTGGTATTSDFLLVLYRRVNNGVGIAMMSGVSGDIGAVLIAPSTV